MSDHLVADPFLPRAGHTLRTAVRNREYCCGTTAADALSVRPAWLLRRPDSPGVSAWRYYQGAWVAHA